MQACSALLATGQAICHVNFEGPTWTSQQKPGRRKAPAQEGWDPPGCNFRMLPLRECSLCCSFLTPHDVLLVGLVFIHPLAEAAAGPHIFIQENCTLICPHPSDGSCCAHTLTISACLQVQPGDGPARLVHLADCRSCCSCSSSAAARLTIRCCAFRCSENGSMLRLPSHHHCGGIAMAADPAPEPHQNA